MLPDRIRTFNKHVTNRLLRRFTNCSRGPFAIIHHVGRRSFPFAKGTETDR